MQKIIANGLTKLLSPITFKEFVKYLKLIMETNADQLEAIR